MSAILSNKQDSFLVNQATIKHQSDICSFIESGAPILLTPTFLRAIKRDVVNCHTLALDYDINQLGN